MHGIGMPLDQGCVLNVTSQLGATIDILETKVSLHPFAIENYGYQE